MTDLTFDVLLPVYLGDRLDFVRTAIDSILSNSILPVNLVVVKDGPVRAEVQDFLINLKKSNEIVQLIDLENNSGLSSALNYGLKFCKSRYTIRCDADDRNFTDRFESILQHFLLTGADIVGSHVIEVDEATGSERIKRVPIGSARIRAFSRWRNPVNHMSVAFDREKIVDLGGYPHVLLKEDYCLWLNALSKGYKISNIDRCLVMANAGESMLRRRSNSKSLQSEFLLFRFRYRLRFDGFLISVCSFLVRVIILSLPFSVLKKVYRHLRG